MSMKIIFKDKDRSEEEKKIKELVKTIETKELKNKIKENEKFISIAQKEFNKRPDRRIREVISDKFMGIIDYGLIVFIFGLIMLGAIPSYFNVNDEFLNPTLNISVNDSFEIVSNAGYKVIGNFHDVGTKHPEIYFWLFFVIVFMWLVYPIIEVIIYIIIQIS